MFEHDSRYYSLEDRTLVTAQGHRVVYRARRLLPRAETGQWLAEVVVNSNDRADLIANRALQRSELFWQVCDSNAIMDPYEMTAQPGRRLRVLLSIPGM